MASSSKKPAAKKATTNKVTALNKSGIQPRHMDFTFDDGMGRYWYGGDQFKTLLFTALSCTFPEGERFFMRSVRRYEKALSSSDLRARVKGFIGQEAHHGKEHDGFNHFMQRQGVNTGKVDAFVKEGMKNLEKWLSPERKLAKTCALEHFTAMLAELVLENDDFLEGMDDRMLPLWLWHAIEESEHKSVAFDVYADQVDSYWVRTSEMVFTTVEFLSFTAFHYVQLQRSTDDKVDWTSVARGLNWLAGAKPGWLRKLRRSYLAYYKPSFHPSKRDSLAVRKRALKKLAKMLNRPDLAEAYVA